MATFHIGQRVRKVAIRRPADVHLDVIYNTPVGAVGTVMGFEDGEIAVLYDAYPSPHWSGEVLNLPYQLTPLTDPLAEKFIASIKALGPLEVERV